MVPKIGVRFCTTGYTLFWGDAALSTHGRNCSNLLLASFLAVHLTSALISVSCQPTRPTNGVQPRPTANSAAPQHLPTADFQGVKTIADIAKLSFVNKRCRIWAADGDIDIDQTCLVARTVAGQLVVIPNEYSDKEMEEVVGYLGAKSMDRWLKRFYEIGGGEK